MRLCLSRDETMKRVVVIDDLREFDIRPTGLRDRYVELVKADIAAYFGDDAGLVQRSCPLCADEKWSDAFQKFGLQYVQCSACLTVYLSPSPSPDLIARYYRDSEASRFWTRHFMKDTARNREERIFKPRINWMLDIVAEYGDGPPALVDVNSKYEPYLEALDKSGNFDSRFAIDPAGGLAEVCARTRFRVIDKPIGEVKPGDVQGSIVTAFEVLERVFSTDDLMSCVSNVLPSGGLLLLTTLSVSGFDLQVLWDKAKNIIPPDHINLPSIEGIIRLMDRYGFEIIELSTPGQLDTEIVKHALETDPDMIVPRFVSYLMSKRDVYVHQDFQEFLQRHRLSSHVRVAARKK